MGSMFALLMVGCGGNTSPPSWTDQVSPSGPCWEVNLTDGLDESSTDELHGLFDCLNQGGNLDPFAGPRPALTCLAQLPIAWIPGLLVASPLA